jgi:hypothetical protein
MMHFAVFDSRELHNEELHNLYTSPSIIRIIRVKEDEMGRASSTNGEKKNTYTILLGKPEGKRPLERPRRKWVDNIKIYLREIEWDGTDGIDLAQDRDQWRALVNKVMNFRIP